MLVESVLWVGFKRGQARCLLVCLGVGAWSACAPEVRYPADPAASAALESSSSRDDGSWVSCAGSDAGPDSAGWTESEAAGAGSVAGSAGWESSDDADGAGWVGAGSDDDELEDGDDDWSEEDDDVASVDEEAVDEWEDEDEADEELADNEPQADEEGGSGGEIAARCVELEEQALTMLDDHCASCHGPGTNISFDYVLESDTLISSGKIVPGASDESSVVRRVLSGNMPPASVSARPEDEDVDALADWVDNCL